MNRTTLSVIIFLALALLLSACGAQNSANAAAETPAAAEAIKPAAVIAEGRLEPANMLDQAFLLPGQVGEVLVQDGESVQAGQVLARLIPAPEAELALARAQEEALAAQQALDALESGADAALAQARQARYRDQAALDEAKTAFEDDESEENEILLQQAQAVFDQSNETYFTLARDQGVDPLALAAAQARQQAAQAAVRAAQSALDARALTATLSGVVVDLALQPGQQVSAGQPVLTIADYGAWLVRTDNLTESEVVAVQVGQPVQVTLDALPGQTLAGAVTHINARFEEKRGDITYTVTVQLDEADPQARWGMTAAVRFLP